MDQIKCKNKGLCLLPSNDRSFPYRDPNIAPSPPPPPPSYASMVEAAVQRAISLSVVAKRLLPEKMEGGAATIPSFKAGRQKQKVNNFLTSVDIGGWRPFDIFNGPVQFPYDLSDKQSPWYFFNFKQWFGNMQITSWSMCRGILHGYLFLFRSFITTKNPKINYWTRLIVTILLPFIISIAVIISPFVTWVINVWSTFKGGQDSILWSIISFFIPFIIFPTMFLQILQLIAYTFIGGILGSGQQQLTTNLHSKRDYMGILQGIIIIILITGCSPVLFNYINN